jgi:N-acetylmuramoyl-L-alanine amidase CwlA
MNAPYVTCSQCGRRLTAWRDTQGGYHVMPHKEPAGAVCPGRLLTDHQPVRPVLV